MPEKKSEAELAKEYHDLVEERGKIDNALKAAQVHVDRREVIEKRLSELRVELHALNAPAVSK